MSLGRDHINDNKVTRIVQREKGGSITSWNINCDPVYREKFYLITTESQEVTPAIFNEFGFWEVFVDGWWEPIIPVAWTDMPEPYIPK